MRLQFLVSLSIAHDVFHHARTAGDRGIPFPSPNPKPTRNEALQYYRLVAAHYKLDVRQYETR